MAHLADIAGVVVDMRLVPSHDGPKDSALRSTGQGYASPDGDVARVEVVGRPADEADTEA
jgi:hypothetical protein